MVPAVMMPPMAMVPVTAMPAAVPHDVDGRHLIGRGGDSGAEPGRRGRRELRYGENNRRTGQSHQNEFAHGLTSVVAPSTRKEAPFGLNST